MAGTQGSSYSSSSKAAAGNKATTQNLQKGLNASGSAKTSSGLGNRPASSSVNAAAAAAARTAAARAATASTQRTQANSSVGGYGRSSPASASVNAAAARAAMMNNQRQAGVTQSYGGKGDAFGANQTVSKGVNVSPGDMLAGGYGAYKNPVAGIAMAARPNVTVANKGVNLSSGDLLAGGYGQYRQAPSMQSTPQTAAGGWNDLAGLQRAVAGMNPSLGNIVAGTLRSPLGTVTTNGEIGGANWQQSMMNGGYGPVPSQIASINYGQTPFVKDISRVPQGGTTAVASAPQNYNWNGSPNIAAANAAGLNQPFNVNVGPKVAMEGGIPGAISPDSVPSLPNYGPSVSVANREPSPYDAQTQVAGYQNPGRAFPSRSVAPQTASISPMAGNGQTFRSPASAAQYNRAMTGLLGGATQVAEAPASASDPGATSDYGLYDQPSTPQQKVGGYLEQKFEKIANPLQKAGAAVNGLFGGSGYNDLYGRQGMTNSNARDELNNLPPKERERVVTEAGKASEDPEFRALSDADKSKVLELIKTGMSLADALKAIKTGTTTTPITRPTYRYPQYYTDWAGLPSGQTYG